MRFVGPIPRASRWLGRLTGLALALVSVGATGCSIGPSTGNPTSRERPVVELEVAPPKPEAAPVVAPSATVESGPAVPEQAPVAEAVPEPDAPRYPSGAGQWARRVPPRGAPRVYAKTRNVWIKGDPDQSSQWIGFLWFGTSVELAQTEPVPGVGCSAWYAVKPRGYVCVDGERATLDPDDPVVAGLYPYGANVEAANPHPFYGESIDAQRYVALPTQNAQAAREWDYRKRLSRIAEARAGGERVESLLGIDLTPAPESLPVLPELPTNLQQPHRRLIARSSVAWSREARFEGRDFLLTDDLTWVPKDRVKPYPEVTFRGVHLGPGVEWPIAFVRGGDQPQYERDGDVMRETEETVARLSWLPLTGETLVTRDATYHATRAGFWLRGDGLAVPELLDKTPWGASVGKPDDSGEPQRGRATWVDVSVLGGWLVAYEGTRPVFTTMIAPGRGGVPERGRPALDTSATPTGRFKITGKFVTATMIAPNDLVHSAVPWAQNFSGPHALHGAYWHDAWGEKKSGGCINLSPQDSRFMFDWTEPKVPEGWHGVRWLPKKEAATTLLVRK